MKFNEFKYVRPDIDLFVKKVNDLTDKFKNANSYEEAEDCLKNVLSVSDDFGTAGTICSIRNTINTTDEFYEKEQEFFDENDPVFQNALNKFNQELVSSKYRSQLEQVYPKQFFVQVEIGLKCFDEKIMPELVQEAKLCTKFSKIVASAKIEFNGKIHNLSQMGIYAQNPNREIRKAAELKTTEFRDSIKADLDDIYEDDSMDIQDNDISYDNYENIY